MLARSSPKKFTGDVGRGGSAMVSEPHRLDQRENLKTNFRMIDRQKGSKSLNEPMLSFHCATSSSLWADSSSFVPRTVETSTAGL
jgi:hypothetical protein